MTQEERVEIVESEAETSDSDDSHEDPNFDFLEETRSRFLNLSIKKKSNISIHKEIDEGAVDDDDAYVIEIDDKDQKSFETVQKIIEVGQVEKLKVEQCKLYLRKHGLRLTGTKDVLIQRVKEHVSVMNGDGEIKYPPSSFVMNCKGDACTGDIVMFEQNVYEMFSIASRSATGPPCGTSVVAGRIIKESYGAAKQQHTFTIEVLWSKGVKPLPPLHPLLIKGRNLYRLKTMRQRWKDESQRQKILLDKHARGDVARSKRETRLQEKEMRKAHRENRMSKNNIENEKRKKKRNSSPAAQPLTTSLRDPSSQNISIELEDINQLISSNPHANVPFEGVLGKMPLTSMIHNHRNKENINFNIHNGVSNRSNGFFETSQSRAMRFCPSSQFESRNYEVQANFNRFHKNHGFQGGNNNGHLQGQWHGQRQQICRYYAQGRCHYGTNCKYLH